MPQNLHQAKRPQSNGVWRKERYRYIIHGHVWVSSFMRLFCRFAIIQFETKFLPRPGSARLALPAEARALRARRLRRPARRARGYRSFCSRAPQGDTSPAPNSRIGRNGSRFEKNSGLTRGVLTKFRLAQAPRGSRFLRKPAPCGRGGCAAPLAALGGYRSFCSRAPQGKSIRPNITPQWKKPCRSPRGARR